MKARSLPAEGEPASDSFPCIVSAWTSHEAALLAYLRHRLADQAAADDVLQDAFVRAGVILFSMQIIAL